MNAELTQKLDGIVNKTFNYEGKNVKITGWKNVNGTNVVVFINGRPRNFYISEVAEFLDALYEVLPQELQSTEVAIPKRELEVYRPTKENEEVKQTLLETLRKVKEDKDFIAQAQAVCDVVNQIVQVQKTEIQMLNLIKKKSK